MAIDTRNKRFSMMGLNQPSPSVMANPDGTIGLADKAQLLFLYAGIALAVPVIVSPDEYFILESSITSSVAYTTLMDDITTGTIGLIPSIGLARNSPMDGDITSIISGITGSGLTLVSTVTGSLSINSGI